MANGRLFVSAREVAERAGVSRSAVSSSFTPGASVAPETRRKVLEAAEALGYHVNQLARGLMRNESGIISLIASDLNTPYRSSLLRALTDRLQAAGKVAMLVNTDRSDDSVDNALRQAIRYRADASIVLSGMPDKSIIDLCLKSGQRLVLINRDDPVPGPFRINLDDEAAARRIASAFVRAGCRRLAFATSQAGTPSLVAREKGFIAACATFGLNVVVERYGHTGYAAGRKLAEILLTEADRPDAIFCATDLIAVGLMDGARHQFGLRIPEDLSVAGFDNIEQAGWSSYDLTTFEQPIDQIAASAVDWLVWHERDRPGAPPPASSIQLTSTLIWRRSVRTG